MALKILPETFAHGPERVARFQREAKTLAALNHPHIGGIYGVEEAPGVTALVLEQGRETPIAAPPRAYIFPRLSPDGTRVAVYAADQESDIWVWDLGRTTLTRVTFDPGFDSYPV